MNPATGGILSLAYILGLLSTSTAWGKFLLVGLAVAIATVLPRIWRKSPPSSVWLLAGFIGFLASFYFQMRVPQPAANDISNFVPTLEAKGQEQVVTVQGKAISSPRITRSQRAQFWLQATQVSEVHGSNTDALDRSQGVTGKVYVTVPLLQATGLHPGETLAVTGTLYKPNLPNNPGSFDFRAYLARQGAFAGLSGRQINIPDTQSNPWGWWAIRQRIIRAQVNWLGSPEGLLVSSIVLGSKAVDLPYEIRDQFIQVGLAHTLAASGFHVSLILSLLLALTRRLPSKTQFTLGTLTLIAFVGLTGMQPSVMRAAVMGFGALVALVTQRKRKPLGVLLIAATILLLLNPLWIWDLGFQLSFLATLGLLITVPPLMKKLDALPSTLAAVIAVPIAASLWTLPLQLYVFGIVAPYSIMANVVTIPLITAISVVGTISAIAGLIAPILGSAIAWLLYYPTHWLIAIVQFFVWLPGNSIAVGKISLLQLIALYGLIPMVWLNPWWHRRWWLAGLTAVMLVIIPIWQTQLTLFKTTVLATAQQQVLVVQDRTKVLLVNSGDAETASFTVLPFLQQQGINQIDWGIGLDTQARLRAGWFELLRRFPVKTFYQTSTEPASAIVDALQARQGVYQPLPIDTTVNVGSTPVKLVSATPPALELDISGQHWLVLGDAKPEVQKQLSQKLSRVDVLNWSGGVLTVDLLKVLQPKVAIASSSTVNSDTLRNLQRTRTHLYWTGRDGAIQWTQNNGFEPTLDAIDNNAMLL